MNFELWASSDWVCLCFNSRPFGLAEIMSGAECEDSLCVNACLADGLSLIAQVTFIFFLMFCPHFWNGDSFCLLSHLAQASSCREKPVADMKRSMELRAQQLVLIFSKTAAWKSSISATLRALTNSVRETSMLFNPFVFICLFSEGPHYFQMAVSENSGSLRVSWSQYWQEGWGDGET